MSRIAILGVGKVGTAIARAALAGGHDVVLAGSGSPEPAQFIVDVMAPGASTGWASEAVHGSDLVILATPLPKLESLDPTMLAGHLVVDAMNPWEPPDGVLPLVFAGADSTSAVVERHLAGARVVKALNHIGYHEMEHDARPADAPDRRGLAAVSNELGAAEAVSEIFAARFSAAEVSARLAHAAQGALSAA